MFRKLILALAVLSVLPFFAPEQARADNPASIQSVTTVALARKMTGPRNGVNTITMIGFSAAGDGFSQTLYWNGSSTCTDDGGETCLQPTGIVTGRWVSTKPFWTSTVQNIVQPGGLIVMGHVGSEGHDRADAGIRLENTAPLLSIANASPCTPSSAMTPNEAALEHSAIGPNGNWLEQLSISSEYVSCTPGANVSIARFSVNGYHSAVEDYNDVFMRACSWGGTMFYDFETPRDTYCPGDGQVVVFGDYRTATAGFVSIVKAAAPRTWQSANRNFNILSDQAALMVFERGTDAFASGMEFCTGNNCALQNFLIGMNITGAPHDSNLHFYDTAKVGDAMSITSSTGVVNFQYGIAPTALTHDRAVDAENHNTQTDNYGVIAIADGAGANNHALYASATAGTVTNYAIDIASGLIHMNGDSTGAGTPSLGANSPAVTLTAPYKWLKFAAQDGSIVWVPAWK